MALRHDELNDVSAQTALAHALPHVLIVTTDLCFYSAVAHSAASDGWRSYWARTLDMTLALSRSVGAPIVIYDANLPEAGWRRAFRDIGAAAVEPRIILAVPTVDEQLWEEVLCRGGYDVVCLTATSGDLKRTIRFAWLSMFDPCAGDESPSELPARTK